MSIEIEVDNAWQVSRKIIDILVEAKLEPRETIGTLGALLSEIICQSNDPKALWSDVAKKMGVCIDMSMRIDASFKSKETH